MAMIPIANTVVRQPNSLIPHTINGTVNPATLTPPSTIDIAVARRLIIHAFVAVNDGVKPPALKPIERIKKAKYACIGPVILENKINPAPPTVKPTKTIFPDPNVSVNHPSTGPSKVPPNRPNVAMPEITVRDHPNSSSIALNNTLAAWNVGAALNTMLNAPATVTHQPK